MNVALAYIHSRSPLLGYPFFRFLFRFAFCLLFFTAFFIVWELFTDVSIPLDEGHSIHEDIIIE